MISTLHSQTATLLIEEAVKTRNWQSAGPVWLNPETEISAPEIRDAA